jgi:glycosyltransferase involved in cell wall biosynthesis
VAVSNYQRRQLGRPELPVIYNGITTDSFPFSRDRGDYLLFVGNLVAGKGAEDAIAVAKRAGMQIVLAGAPADAGGTTDYFDQTLRPLLDHPSVQYVGWAAPAYRNELLAGAAALIYPITVPETFGLVMVESMVCGTPVLALERGAVPEVVTTGLTGYYAPTVEAHAAYVPAVLALDRWCVREEAVRRFDVRRMVDEYETLYRKLVSMRRTEQGWLAAG